MTSPGERRKRDADLGTDAGDHFLQDSAESFQDNLRRSGPVAAASYSLTGGILLLGGLGYWADAHFGTGPWLLLGGLLAGIVVGFYELIKSVRHP